MLTISTIPEALAQLEKLTGRAWTDSELFDVATRHSLKLNAAAPITAQTTIQEFAIGEGLKEKFRSSPGHCPLAVLFPFQVAQLWIVGETTTAHPAPSRMEREGEYHWFTEPVRVTREQVRIKAHSLKKILDAWSNAQAGRWVDDETVQGGKRLQIGPDWMFPQPATDTQATPAAGKMEADKGITKQKVIAAFAGLHFDTDAQWGKALADTPKWLLDCRVTKGLKGNNAVSATWNPVLIAAALYDKGITTQKLDAVFVGLKDWADEWREASDGMR